MTPRSLLPDTVRSPWCFMGAHALPLAALSLLVARAWGLVKGEASPACVRAYATAGAALAAVLLGAIATGLVLCARRRRVQWPVALAFLALNAGLLWIGLARVGVMVPATVSDWMLAPAHLAFTFLCLATPALFYCALCVAAVPLPGPVAADIAGSAVTLVLVPAAWYVFAVLGHRLFSFRHFPYAAWLTLFILSTAVLFFAFLRLLMWLYRVAQGRWPLALAAGLILPMAGLILNAWIPFPTDFQYASVYVLTVVNGVALLIPFSAARRHALAVWAVRSATYPFSLYFFLIFLPFLPLSIPAMLAAGGGFLILAPTFLFLMHSQQLHAEALALRERVSATRLAMLFACALALLPLGYTSRALIHRVALSSAVNAVYSPDYFTDRPRVHAGVTRIALSRLQAMKAGIYLPFLTEYYNRLVFNGMVLPDHKVSVISRAVCGEDLSRRPQRIRRFGRFGDESFMTVFGARGRTRSWSGTRLPARDVQLDSVTVASVTTNAETATARLELRMRNGSTPGAEFASEFVLPPEAFVSGYELEMAGQWVDGRVFDRKSALWVYHMIRDTTRRDPGLVTVGADGHGQVSVFPFAASETRRCALKIAFPPDTRPVLTVGAQTVRLGDPTAAGMPLDLARTDGSRALLVPASAAGPVPWRRPWCAHFLLDGSVHSSGSISGLTSRVAAFLDRHPWVTNTAATAVNFGSQPLLAPGASPRRLTQVLAEAGSGEHEGGFCPDLAIARDILRQADAAQAPAYATAYVIVGAGTNVIPLAGAAGVRRLAPDCRLLTDRDDLEREAAPVLLLRRGAEWQILPAAGGGWAFFPAVDDAPIEALDGAAGAFRPFACRRVAASGSRLGAAAEMAALDREMLVEPSRIDGLRPAVLAISRESGVLAPQTAYIVVENSAQWALLERAQKQSLASGHVLEFDEFVTPEPGVGWVLAGFAVWWALRRRLGGTVRRAAHRRGHSASFCCTSRSF